jgi:hypothetical protein
MKASLIVLGALVSAGSAFTLSSLTGNCAIPSLGTPFSVYTEGSYTYVIYNNQNTDWNGANVSCATLFPVHAQLASYRSSTIQTGLESLAATTGNLRMFIGFGLFNGASTGGWLDPTATNTYGTATINLANPLDTANSIAQYSPGLKQYLPRTPGENQVATVVCEVQSKVELPIFHLF